MMSDRIRKAFDNIQADENLKEVTKAYLKVKLQKQNKTKKLSGFVMIAFLILLFSGNYIYTLYFTPFSYIDMDINPSFELAVNRFDKIITAKSYNSEGEDILTDVDLVNKNYQEAIDILVEKIADNGYLSDDKLLSVTIQSDSLEKEAVLLKNIRVLIGIEEHYYDASLEIFTVSKEIKIESRNMDFTPAKYLAAIELHNVNPQIKLEDCHNHSISEIKQLTEEHHKSHTHSDDNSLSEDEPEIDKSENLTSTSETDYQEMPISTPEQSPAITNNHNMPANNHGRRHGHQ